MWYEGYYARLRRLEREIQELRELDEIPIAFAPLDDAELIFIAMRLEELEKG